MIFVLFGLFLVSSPLFVTSRNIVNDWEWQDNGGFFIAKNCDFFGGDLNQVHLPREQCQSTCASTESCHAFTWSPSKEGGTCYLKKELFSLEQATYLLSASCGLKKESLPVPERAKFVWQDDGFFNWSTNCDFWGGDMIQMKIGRNECAPQCSKTYGCNAFTWSYSPETGQTCYMKSKKFSIEEASYAKNAVCGRRKDSKEQSKATLPEAGDHKTTTPELDGKKETTNPDADKKGRTDSTPETEEQRKATTPEAGDHKTIILQLYGQKQTTNPDVEKKGRTDSTPETEEQRKTTTPEQDGKDIRSTLEPEEQSKTSTSEPTGQSRANTHEPEEHWKASSPGKD